MNIFDIEVRRAYIRGIFHQHKKCLHSPEILQEILSEHGIDYVDHSCCDGFCPECIQIHNCEAYEEIKDEWKGFYS